jgi:hypothetical protein
MEHALNHGGSVSNSWRGFILRICLVATAWSVSVSNLAAEEPVQPQQMSMADEELGEVLVEGDRAKKRRPGFKQAQSNFDWLARLVGQFVVDGQVELKTKGDSKDSRKVSGRAECTGFGAAPGVICELKIRWPDLTGPGGESVPGGVSDLDPAVVLYGFDIGRVGISYILVDSRGAAETSVGELFTADTMHSRAKCGAISGNCERMTRITAWPDLMTIDMEMNIQIDQEEFVGFKFAMHRVPGAPSVVYGRKQEKER